MSAGPAPIDPSLRIGSVALAVSDMERSADFYENVLGLPAVARIAAGATPGAGERSALQLSAIEQPAPAPVGSTGLFHVAWLHPSRAALADTVRRIARAGWPIDGAADHGVSEALYLSDPDGLGIEIYADRPRSQWQRAAGGHGVNMVTLPLDVQDLLAQSDAEPPPRMGPQVTIGHVHLKVSDVPRSLAFYRDALGFEEQAELPSAAFLAAGRYHHHIGLNSWQSRGQGPASERAPRLMRIRFELGDADALAALQARLGGLRDGADPGPPANEELCVSDPDGELLCFAHR